MVNLQKWFKFWHTWAALTNTNKTKLGLRNFLTVLFDALCIKKDALPLSQLSQSNLSINECNLNINENDKFIKFSTHT